MNEIIEKLSKRKVDHLRFLLTLNDQQKTGNKQQLLQRIAEGMVLGAIPRCPNCGGGRPKYDSTRNAYRCKGFMDDSQFKWCHNVIQLDQLQRIPWKDDPDD